jgi:acyl-CoA thioester hydrolase
MHYSLWSETQNQIVATGEAVMVCVDKVTSNKLAIPELIKQNIIAIEQSVGNNLVLK